MTPDRALALLQEGNERFLDGKMQPRDLLAEVRATAGGQSPFAAVLGCIDSRVPPELVFDQGIGDIFSVRVAGNFASTEILGSLEFATKVAAAKLIVVLGHSGCGAVQGACDHVRLGHLTATLEHLAAAVATVTDVHGDRDGKNAAFVQAVSDANVQLTVTALTARSDVLRSLVETGELRIIGAMHDIATGRVTFWD